MEVCFGNETNAQEATGGASAGAGLTTDETEGARPGGAGVRTEGKAQPSASVEVILGISG